MPVEPTMWDGGPFSGAEELNKIKNEKCRRFIESLPAAPALGPRGTMILLMEEILHQLRLVVYPAPSFTGFYTSQVVQDFWTINSIMLSFEHVIVFCHILLEVNDVCTIALSPVRGILQLVITLENMATQGLHLEDAFPEASFWGHFFGGGFCLGAKDTPL